MDGYFGSDDILEKLEYACQGSPTVDLYWGDVMPLLTESRDEIKRLRERGLSTQTHDKTNH
jgi:hypothetical protein